MEKFVLKITKKQRDEANAKFADSILEDNKLKIKAKEKKKFIAKLSAVCDANNIRHYETSIYHPKVFHAGIYDSLFDRVKFTIHIDELLVGKIKSEELIALKDTFAQIMDVVAEHALNTN